MKKSFRHFVHEAASIVRSRKALISVSVVALIPLLYTFMFLWAFWDPYAKMDVLPVAVVNMDRGAVMDGKEVSVGGQFVDKLKSTPSFDWHFVTQEEARAGLKDHTYYMSIEIPEDFSERAVKVLGPEPQQAVFRYIPNESANFLASQIGKSAMERIKGELSAQLTKTYAETLFTGFGKLSDGLAQAAEGAKELSDGTQRVENGVEQLDVNLEKLSVGAQPLKTGAQQLFEGAAMLNEGLTRLQGGADRLNGGMLQLLEGRRQLSLGVSQAEQGLAKLSEGMDGSAAGLEQLKQGTAGLSAGLEQTAASHPELAQDPGFAALVDAGKQAAAGAEQAAAAQQQLAGGAARLAQGQKALNEGLAQFGEKLAEAQQGSRSLADGAKQLLPGGAQLKSGLAQLTNGMSSLADGTVQLDEGAKKLVDGASNVASGTGELSGRLKDASVQTSSVHGSDRLYQAISQPVAFEEQKIAQVPNYGTGFAPYFLSLGLFVGALVLTIVFPVKEPAVTPKSGMSWFLGKLGILLLVGFIQAVVTDAVMLLGLGLEPQYTALFIVFSILTSWTFMILIQMLVTLLGDPGRFLGIVILIMQLTTCAGTFPVELIPDVLRHLSGWLPMTYSVQGYKAVISSGELGDLRHAMEILGIYFGGFAAVTMTYFILHFRRRMDPSSKEMNGKTVAV